MSFQCRLGTAIAILLSLVPLHAAVAQQSTRSAERPSPRVMTCSVDFVADNRGICPNQMRQRQVCKREGRVVSVVLMGCLGGN